MTFISKFLTGIWLKVAGAAVIAAALLATYASIRRGGKLAERAAAKDRILKDVEVRNEVDRSVALEPDPAGRLRDRWSRD